MKKEKDIRFFLICFFLAMATIATMVGCPHENKTEQTGTIEFPNSLLIIQ
jgi:hypothetical protein